MLTQMEISLLIRLLIAHLLTDFVFQNNLWVKEKYEGGWHSKYLYVHGAVAGILAYLFSGLWTFIWIPVIIAVTHTIIDGIKTKYDDNIKSFLLDQLVHLVVILIIWLWMTTPSPEDYAVFEQTFLHGINFWIILTAYLVIIWPSSVLINKLTEEWRSAIEKTDNKDTSLENAGRWIGRLERFLILTLVLLEQYEAIGLLVAAKSIFRFSKSRDVGEYVLIGTLISFTIAIIVGLIANMFL